MIFGIGFGALLVLFGFLSITQIDPSALKILGMSRGLVFGLPLLFIGLMMIVSGIMVKLNYILGVNLLVFAGFSLLIADLFVEIGMFGTIFAFQLISIVIYIIPFILLAKSTGVREAILKNTNLANENAAQDASQP